MQKACAASRNDGSVNILTSLLEVDDVDVKIAAVTSLGEVGDDHVTALIRQLAVKTPADQTELKAAIKKSAGEDCRKSIRAGSVKKKERRRSFCKKEAPFVFLLQKAYQNLLQRIVFARTEILQNRNNNAVVFIPQKCYSENNTDTKAERGAKSIRRKKGGNKMEFVFEHATMIAVIAVVVIILAILASGYVKAPPDTAFIISGFKKASGS